MRNRSRWAGSVVAAAKETISGTVYLLSGLIFDLVSLNTQHAPGSLVSSRSTLTWSPSWPAASPAFTRTDPSQYTAIDQWPCLAGRPCRGRMSAHSKSPGQW